METTYQDFILLCRSFEEKNHNSFDPISVRAFSFNPNNLYYDATFRDEHNYKTRVRISFEDAQISWETCWEDADDELRELYEELLLTPYRQETADHYFSASDLAVDIERSFLQHQSGLI